MLNNFFLIIEVKVNQKEALQEKYILLNQLKYIWKKNTGKRKNIC